MTAEWTQIDEMVTTDAYRAVVAYCNAHDLDINDFLLRALESLQGAQEGQNGKRTNT